MTLPKEFSKFQWVPKMLLSRFFIGFDIELDLFDFTRSAINKMKFVLNGLLNSKNQKFREVGNIVDNKIPNPT